VALDHRVKAIGALSRLFMHPKPDDIAIVYEEKRYRAFWRVVGSAFLKYRRSTTYRVPLEACVIAVDVEGRDYPVNRNDRSFAVTGTELCEEHLREEIIVDAQTEQSGDFSKYLTCSSRSIDTTDLLTADGSTVVNIDVKASYLVRKILGTLMKPFKADEILNEEIAIEMVDLFFYPVYIFEYLWTAKDKKVLLEFDGVTGEVRKGERLTDRLKKSFSGDDAFDFAKEVAGFVPGGGLAMMAGRKAYQIVRRNTKGNGGQL